MLVLIGVLFVHNVFWVMLYTPNQDMLIFVGYGNFEVVEFNFGL